MDMVSAFCNGWLWSFIIIWYKSSILTRFCMHDSNMTEYKWQIVRNHVHTTNRNFQSKVVRIGIRNPRHAQLRFVVHLVINRLENQGIREARLHASYLKAAALWCSLRWRPNINFFMQISRMTVFKWELQGTRSEPPAQKIHTCSIWARLPWSSVQLRLVTDVSPPNQETLETRRVCQPR